MDSAPSREYYYQYIAKPEVSLREIPLNLQYIGHNPGLVSELIGLATRASFPSLNVNLLQQLPDTPSLKHVEAVDKHASRGAGVIPAAQRVLRLGVVSGTAVAHILTLSFLMCTM